MFHRIQRVHFVGVGGIGMCGIAEVLHASGYRVSGSDMRDGPTLERLRSLGVGVTVGHATANVGDADVVVYSSAIRPGNPELVEAERCKIPVIPRAEMLGELMRLKHGVAVGGTHGKTTTTSLISHVLHVAGLDPTSVIGGRVIATGHAPTGARHGAGHWIVAEADESDGSFLRLAPVVAVVTNVDPEHLDHYGSLAAIEDAFVAFANRVPFWGLAVVCMDHPGVQAILPRLTRRVTTYGLSPQADLVATDVTTDGWGMRFTVRRRGEMLGAVHLRIPGLHNVANALATVAVALELDVPFSGTAEALASFVGIERRFWLRGEAAGVRVVDDYGHHPAEIRATLAAARGLHDGRVVVVFQPHRYTRTRDLFEEFAGAFHDADVVCLTEIYAAGEDKIPGVEAQRLAEEIRARGHREVRFVADLDAIPDALVPDLHAGDLVLTLGAGSISGLGPALLARLGEPAA
jgi:UDP-N-acetylmuramate--alanine ligase